MMKARQMLLIAAAAGAVAIGSITFGLSGRAGANACGTQTQTATACARCGDGVCARSCENEKSCPADCKAVDSETEKAVRETSAEQAAVVN